VIALFVFAFLGCAPAPPVAAGDLPKPPEAAPAAFAALAADCRADGGALWGRSLCGPVLLVERDSRLVWANQAGAEGRLRARDGVFSGRLGPEVPLANTAVDWGGTRWAMVLLPLPDDPRATRRLLLHESFHRIQGELGLGMSNPQNAHLDGVDGRVLLQLEWRALAAALRAPGDDAGARRSAVRDALLLRWRRQALFPAAREEEAGLERNEGLAEYTAVRLAGDTTDAIQGLERGPRQPSFVRSFAYASGPAYGLLLDGALPGWRARLDARSDLGALLGEAYRVEHPADLAAAVAARSAVYGGPALAEAERHRQEERTRRMNDYRKRLVDGPVLRLPFRKMSISFDPNAVEVLEGQGNVYPRGEIRDAWGLLRVSDGGMLVDNDWSSVRVAATPDLVTKDGVVRGAGWTLELGAGWRMVAGQRPGDATIAGP